MTEIKTLKQFKANIGKKVTFIFKGELIKDGELALNYTHGRVEYCLIFNHPKTIATFSWSIKEHHKIANKDGYTYGWNLGQHMFGDIVKDLFVVSESAMDILKAGMIVKLKDGSIRIALPTTAHSCGLGLFKYDGSGSSDPETSEIEEVYHNGYYIYLHFFKNGVIPSAWECIYKADKSDPKQDQIDEIKETIKQLEQQVNNLETLGE